MNTLHRVSRRQVVGCGLLLAAGGCSRGPRTVRVAGKVSYQGKPVPEGLIVFFPVDGTAGPSTGSAIANGHYDIPARSGPRAGGTYRVEITAYGPERQYSPNVSGEGPNILHLRKLSLKIIVAYEIRRSDRSRGWPGLFRPAVARAGVS